MLGRHHVASGLAVGLATLPLLDSHTTPTRITWVLGVGGAALLPDLDTPQSSAARMWGPLTRGAASLVALASGGHRHATHDVVVAPLVVGAVLWAATLNPTLAAVVLAVMVGLALHDIARVRLIGWPLNLLASWLTSGWLLRTHRVDWRLLSLAVVVGIVTHIAGDALTTERVPVPVVGLLNRRLRWGLPLFRTGALVETLVVGPALALLVLVLVVRTVHPGGGVPASWHHLAGTVTSLSPIPARHR